MGNYNLTMDDDGSVLRAELAGERSPLPIEMAQDIQVCWEAILWEAKARDLASVLVVSRLTGWVSTSAVIATVEFVRHIAPETVERIAFVDLNEKTSSHNAIAEKVAVAERLKIAVFEDESSARAWLVAAAG
jgi:hypothetical protein